MVAIVNFNISQDWIFLFLFGLQKWLRSWKFNSWLRLDFPVILRSDFKISYFYSTKFLELIPEFHFFFNLMEFLNIQENGVLTFWRFGNQTKILMAWWPGGDIVAVITKPEILFSLRRDFRSLKRNFLYGERLSQKWFFGCVGLCGEFFWVRKLSKISSKRKSLFKRVFALSDFCHFSDNFPPKGRLVRNLFPEISQNRPGILN